MNGAAQRRGRFDRGGRERGEGAAGSPFTFSFGTNIMHDGPRRAADVAAAGGENVLPPPQE